MAGGNDERVNLLISAAVDGLKNVEGLISDLQELEKSGRVELPDNSAALREGLGKTSEEMQALAGRLTELREQQGLVTQFAELKRETKELAEQQRAAKARATELGKALARTEAPTRAQAQEFERAKKAAQGADEAWISNNRQLNELRGEMEAAGISTKDLAGEQVRIRKELDGVNTQAASLSSELTEMGQSAQQAAPATEDVAEAAEDLGEKADKSSGLLSKLGTGLKTVAAGATALIAGIGASAATLTVFSRGQASLADELTNTANAIGVNREALQVWQIAGERVGLTGDKVTDILRSVTERLGEFAATGGGEAAQVMERLNLQIEDFEGLAPDEQMLKFAEAIESLPKAEQVALLEKLGSDASQLQPLLEDNAAGLRAIAEEAAQAGAIYSEEELDKLLRANDIYNSITIKIQGLTRRIGAELAPAVADATDKVVKLFDQNETGEKLIDMFRRITTWGADMATKLVENADDISKGFGTLWNTIESGASGAMAVFRGLQTIVAGWTTLVAGSFATLLSVVEGVTWAMNKVGLVSDETMNSISAKAGAARDTVVDLGKQTAEYFGKAVEAGKGVVTAFDDAGNSAVAASEKIKNAATAEERFWNWVKKNAEDAGNGIDEATRKAKDLEDAYEELGVTSQQELDKTAASARAAFEQIQQSGAATKRELAEAFKVYAQAVIETGDKARIRALATEAAVLGLRDAFKEVEKEAGNVGATATSAMDGVAKETEKAADEAERLKENAKDAGDQAEESGNKAGAAFDWFGAIISSAREGVYALSNAARNLFEQKVGMNNFAKEAETAQDALERVRQELGRVTSSLGRVGAHEGFTRWALELEQSSLQVQKQFWSQAAAMEQLQRKIDAGAYSMEQLAKISDSANTRFDLLDDQRLSGLQSAIDSARAKLESLNSSADSTLSSLRQRLAEIRGDTEEAQRIQYEAERERLEDMLRQAQQAGADEAAADYQQSLDTLEQIYQIEQKNRQEEQNAREKEAADRARDQEMAELERQRSQRELSQPTTVNPARTESVKTVNVNLGGQSFRVLADDESAFLRALENARSTAL